MIRKVWEGSNVEDAVAVIHDLHSLLRADDASEHYIHSSVNGLCHGQITAALSSRALQSRGEAARLKKTPTSDSLARDSCRRCM